MADSPLFVGIDVGTSGVKVIAVDEAGDIQCQSSQPLTLETPQPGWAEQSPSAWWTATVTALKDLTGKVAPARIASIGLSGQMHSSVLLDKAGEVLRPALLWCDGRTSAQCRTIESVLGLERMRSTIGNAAFEGFTLPKILWLRDNEPEAFARLSKVLLPKDYIRQQLSGALSTEPSDASGTLMFDVVKQQFDLDLLKDLGLPTGLAPELGGSAETLSRVSSTAAALTGLPAGTPIAGGGADNACGAVGVGAVGPGRAVLSWGTSGTVLAPTSAPKVDPELRAHTFCHAVPGVWYVMGVMLTAGGAFAWHQRELGKELAGQPVSVLSDEAGDVPAGAEGLTFLPYLQGERTPHKNAGARGAFVGLSLAHTRKHLTRAVLEGICFGYKDSVELLSALGLQSDKILVTGGGSNSPLVRRLLADILNRTLTQVNKEEGPAFGAATLGAVAVGAFPSVASACEQWLSYRETDQPTSDDAEAYSEAYARFRALYPALHPSH